MFSVYITPDKVNEKRYYYDRLCETLMFSVCVTPDKVNEKRYYYDRLCETLMFSVCVTADKVNEKRYYYDRLCETLMFSVCVTAAGRGLPRGDPPQRDPLGDAQRPLHRAHCRAGRHPHLPLLHHRFHVLP